MSSAPPKPRPALALTCRSSRAGCRSPVGPELEQFGTLQYLGMSIPTLLSFAQSAAALWFLLCSAESRPAWPPANASPASRDVLGVSSRDRERCGRLRTGCHSLLQIRHRHVGERRRASYSAQSWLFATLTFITC